LSKQNILKRQWDLPGLGPKSLQCLHEVGIYTKSDLEAIGPVKAYVLMARNCTRLKPSLNLLYALVGALEGVHWREIAKKEKGRLLVELDGYREMERLLQQPDEKI
jgi:DNA transformation protein